MSSLELVQQVSFQEVFWKPHCAPLLSIAPIPARDSCHILLLRTVACKAFLQHQQGQEDLLFHRPSQAKPTYSAKGITYKTTFPLSFSRKAHSLQTILHEDVCWSPRLVSALAAVAFKLNPRVLCEILRMTPNPELAMRVFLWADALPHFAHDLSTYHCLIKILGSAKEFEVIWGVIDRMKNLGFIVTDTPSNVLIECYGSAGMYDEAIKTFCSMKVHNCQPTSQTYKEYVSVLVSSNKLNVPWQLFKRCSSLVRGVSVSYSVLNIALCKNGDLVNSKALLEDMKMHDCAPNRYIFHALIDASLKASDEVSALEML